MTSRVVHRAYRYRFYPTAQQVELLNKTFGCVRYVYNRALEERTRAWIQERRRVTHAETDRMLTSWKRDPATVWLTEPSKGPLQAVLRDLQAAFVNFWRKQSKYPKFKKKGKCRASATFYANCFTWRNGRLTLAKCVDCLNIRWSRSLPGGANPSSVTVSRDAANRWYVSLMVEDVVHDAPASTSSVGIDAGITSLATLSTGEKIVNPYHERRDRLRLALVQRRLSRTAKDSQNRTKARLKVAKVYARITDRRKDFLHKLTTRIIRENQTVVIEDLAVRNLIQNHKMARAISDASWSEMRRQLEYKAEWYGRTVIAIDRFYPSSKTCSACGSIIEKLSLNTRSWTCPCGVTHDRDVNAAKNICAAGLAVQACGDGVRPTRS